MGRHLVYANVDMWVSVGISTRRKAAAQGSARGDCTAGGGFVARTAAEGRSLTWGRRCSQSVQRHRQQDGDDGCTCDFTMTLIFVFACARPVMPDLKEIVIDDEVEFARLLDFMRRFMPRYAPRSFNTREMGHL